MAEGNHASASSQEEGGQPGYEHLIVVNRVSHVPRGMIFPTPGTMPWLVTREWALTLTGSVRSGFPLSRIVDGADPSPRVEDRLPWTYILDFSAAREFGTLPGCGGCTWRLFADVRNLLGRENIIALRRDTGTIAPPAAELFAIANQVPVDMEPIPRESPSYTAGWWT